VLLANLGLFLEHFPIQLFPSSNFKDNAGLAEAGGWGLR
jgi:hypothetical protein